MSYFEFAGRRSSEFGLVIDQIPVHNIASRRVDEFEVPGRNGTLIQETGAYSNVEQVYSCWFRSRPNLPPEMVREIAAWLTGSRGYQTLRDSYDPGVFRMARFTSSIELTNWWFRRGRLELAFDCMPQRWLDEGQFPQIVGNGDFLVNRWQRALPLIQIVGSGGATLQVGDYTVTISSIPAAGLILDAEIQDAYNETGNRNSLVTLSNGFPALEQGPNLITWTGDITSVKITPRWWTL